MIHVFSSGLCGKLCPGSVSHEKGAVIGRPGLVTEDRSKEDRTRLCWRLDTMKWNSDLKVEVCYLKNMDHI